MSDSQPNDLIAEILDAIEALANKAEADKKPLEVDPARGELFTLFVKAYQNGLMEDDVDEEDDLSADALCQYLADRWGLRSTMQEWMQKQTAENPLQLAKMRTLWAIMRLWMEWDYSWSRWNEFNES